MIEFNLPGVEPGNVDVEIKLGQGHLKLTQLHGQNPIIPSRLRRQFIVSEHEGTHFRLSKMSNSNDRNDRQIEKLGSLHSSVASHNSSLAVGDDWTDDTEPPNGIGDFAILLLGVGASVAGRGK